jgi:hypothetical protein
VCSSDLSAAQGDLLFRGSTGWQRLAAGTSGQFLKTLGAGADPAWDTPSGGGGSAAWTALLNGYDFSTGAASTKEVDVTGYSQILVAGDQLAHAASVFRSVQVSVDGGANWFTTSGNYQEMTTAGLGTNAEAFLLHGSASSAIRNILMQIDDNVGKNPVNAKMLTRGITGVFRGSATAINRIRLVGINSAGGVNAGNFTSGKLWVYGR